MDSNKKNWSPHAVIFLLFYERRKSLNDYKLITYMTRRLVRKKALKVFTVSACITGWEKAKHTSSICLGNIDS